MQYNKKYVKMRWDVRVLTSDLKSHIFKLILKLLEYEKRERELIISGF